MATARRSGACGSGTTPPCTPTAGRWSCATTAPSPYASWTSSGTCCARRSRSTCPGPASAASASCRSRSADASSGPRGSACSNATRTLLDVGDDVGEWLADRLGTGLGLVDTIENAVVRVFADETPLVRVQDPYPVLPPDPTTVPGTALVPVAVPIADLTPSVTA